MGQVGIGTTAPQKELHIAGANSTIRIEKLNDTNSPIFNQGGTSLTPVFVDGNGDLTLNPPGYNGSNLGNLEPINFLYNVGNFVPDNGGDGVIINNPTTATTASGFITSVNVVVPQMAMVELKYGMTIYLSSTDINTSSSSFSDYSSRTFNIYYCIDINNDGLDATELSNKYGYCGLSYGSGSLGILGYPYMNGFGITELPAGTHSIHFFAETKDGNNKFTSYSFGGAQDYLKIRIFN